MNSLGIQQLQQEFQQLKGAGDQGNAKTLSEWLISKQVISRYQATILLGGRAGPFFYADYKVYDRIESGKLSGMFRAIHVPSNHPVILQFISDPVIQQPQTWPAVARHAQQQCKVSAPQLWPAYDVVDLGSFKFIVWENLQGESLAQKLAGGKKLSTEQAARIARDCALGLQAMHQQGGVAGDLRPGEYLG